MTFESHWDDFWEKGTDEAERGSVPRLEEDWNGRCLVALPPSRMAKTLQPCQQPPVLCLLGDAWEKGQDTEHVFKSMERVSTKRETERFKERGSNRMEIGKRKHKFSVRKYFLSMRTFIL